MSNIECKLCGELYATNINGAFTNHITKEHKMAVQKYYDMFLRKNGEGYCKKCGRDALFVSLSQGYNAYCADCKPQKKKTKCYCEICNKTFTCKNPLGKHIKYIHNLNAQEYYDKYMKQPKEGICVVCGNATSFINIQKGYAKHCCNSCTQLDQNTREKIKSTCLEKYGTESASQSVEIKEKIQKTNNKKYGAACVFSSSKTKQKIKETNIKRYGVDNPAKNKEVQSQTRQTCLERYGFENPLQNPKIQEKTKQTNIERYGVEYPTQSSVVRAKLAKTNRKKWGSVCSLNNKKVKDKAKKTFIAHYGVDNPLQSAEIREQIKQTNLQKYGAENPGANKKVIEKRHQTILEKYGVDNAYQSPEIQEKMKQTKYKNSMLDIELSDADE